MKRKRTIATTSEAKLLAPLCLCGAQTALTYLEELTAAMEGIRRAKDSECVHDMRVASRRLRSILSLLARCLSRKTCDRWREQLRRLTRALGEARDADVQIACVQHFLDQAAGPRERPGVERLCLRLQQRRQGLQEAVLEALERFVASGLTEEMGQTFTQLAQAHQVSGADTPGYYMYRQIGQAMRTRLAALQAYAPYVQQPECSPELHAMRIAAKRLRYTMQACAPLYPGALDAPVRTARTLQTLLGDIHDCDVWMHDLPQFLAAEHERALAYFGQTESLTLLIPGILALQDNRQQYRTQRYQEFVAFWHQVQEHGVWERLHRTLEEAPTQGARQARGDATEHMPVHGC